MSIGLNPKKEPIQVTVQEKLKHLAKKTEMKVGKHPDVDTIVEAIHRINFLESKVNEVPKTTRKAPAKKETQ